jgi:GNAT superfamily N-acetyltransferase
MAAHMQLRNATKEEVDRLARIWYDGWQDAHAAILPEALARLRTLESFRERLLARLPATRVAESDGEIAGFCTLNGDELYQLFVTAAARGSGVAVALVTDAEKRLAEAGVETAWLGCAIGNDRAARFYEKSGWRRAGEVVVAVETSQGPYDLQLWRYEKPLHGRQPI